MYNKGVLEFAGCNLVTITLDRSAGAPETVAANSPAVLRGERPRVVGVLVFLLALVVGLLAVLQSERIRLRHERALSAGYVKDYAHNLETGIVRALSASYALAALVEVGRGDIPDFDDVSARLLPHYPGVSELVLAPGGVISHIAPMSGNEKALGLDLMHDPAQRAEASLTRDSRQLTLAGPLELVQGGQALAGRLPVFLKDPKREPTGEPVFWGFTEVVLRLPGALAPARLAQLSGNGYRYVLWRIQPETRNKQIIQASSNSALIDPVEEIVAVPNGAWVLSVMPERGWTDWWGLTLKSVSAAIVAFVLACLAKTLVELKGQRLELEALASRRAVDMALAKSQLKATLDAIPDLVWLKDPEGVYLSCNPQFERYAGAREADIIGRTDYDFATPEQAEAFRANDRKALEADKPCANEEWLTFAGDGYHGLFETLKTPMRGNDGKLIGVLGIARDITTRYRAERAAKMTKTRLSVALQATQIAIWDWDIKRDRWYASRVYYTSLGYSPEHKRGDRAVWFERVHPEDRPRVLAAIESAMTGKEIYEYEARLRHADGSYRWVSVRGLAVERDERGLATRMLGVRLDITERKNAEERIRRLAHFDTLTGLPNRALLSERMRELFSVAQVSRPSMAVLVVDADRFKNINDTFGHAVGDAVLVEFAKRISSMAREEDMVARIGGDTFVMVVAAAGTVQATNTAQRLVDLLSAPLRTRELELAVTPSIGVALFPTHGLDFESVLKWADTAMHRAKQQGRRRYVFFSEEMRIRSERNLALEAALRRAIDRGELHLHYQPQVSLLDGRITGAEALLRWSSPDLGPVSPTEFIPIIEDSGQILEIGSWVLRGAANQLGEWLAMGAAPFCVAVNLSSVQFRHPNLPGFVRKVLDEANVEGRHLELELTERVAMDDPGAAVAVMKELSEIGVRFSIDDFGTGYSSLSYLKRLRASKLKIDQSFVRGLADDPEDQAIVKAIINLANSLGVETIAEGVETAAQVEFLRAHGCRQAQGFFFSPAVPVDRFSELLRDASLQASWLSR